MTNRFILDYSKNVEITEPVVEKLDKIIRYDMSYKKIKELGNIVPLIYTIIMHPKLRNDAYKISYFRQAMKHVIIKKARLDMICPVIGQPEICIALKMREYYLKNGC